jgi:hypothetical protein
MFLIMQFGRFLELVNYSQAEGRLSRLKKIMEQPGGLPPLIVKVPQQLKVCFVQTYCLPKQLLVMGQALPIIIAMHKATHNYTDR